MAPEGTGSIRLAFETDTTVAAGRSTGRSWSRGGELRASGDRLIANRMEGRDTFENYFKGTNQCTW